MVTNGMEQTYKDALRHLLQEKLKPDQSAQTYEEALFRSVGYMNKLLSFNHQSMGLGQDSVKVATPTTGTISEKTMIIESFQQFGQEKLEANNLKPIAVPGAEIHFKNSPDQMSSSKINLAPWNSDQIQQKIAEILGQDNFHARYSDINSQKIKVLFVSETFVVPDREQLRPDLKAFQYVFETQTAELFANMVKAMRLTKEDYLITAVTMPKAHHENSCTEIVLQEIHHFKPALVISLGITATYALIDTKKRLKDIHGKFFKLFINDFETEVMPLFSPNLLKDAVQMKRNAWEDMQKAMQFLKL